MSWGLTLLRVLQLCLINRNQSSDDGKLELYLLKIDIKASMYHNNNLNESFPIYYNLLKDTAITY